MFNKNLEMKTMDKKKLREEVLDQKTTQELIDKFDELCEQYSAEMIDVTMLRKGVADVISNWSG
jgi:uncharacterized protein YydD (DUF2326 family)